MRGGNSSSGLMVQAVALGIACGSWAAAAQPPEPFRIQLDTITEGYEGRPYDATSRQYMQARSGIVLRPDGVPWVVTTMSPTKIGASDVYFELHEMRTEDLGKTWLGPIRHPETLGRRAATSPEGKPTEEAVVDFWPKWHAKTGKLLGTGQSEPYVTDKQPILDGWHAVAYSVYDAEARAWSAWDTLPTPAAGMKLGCAAGCTQRVDLPNGEILLPVSCGIKGTRGSEWGWPVFETVVLRCGFDGRRLQVLEAGEPLALRKNRGLYEPSLAVFQGRFYLTLRNDDAAYVATSDDGLRFGPIKAWTFDDGADLGSYNTQAHWVTHSNALYLVYTRRGARNDHIFRHRAPLFIAEVETDRLCVKRATERVLIPERGAAYGNFGVCDVSERETWITECEYMDAGGRRLPVDNPGNARARVYAARIIWTEPNEAWDRH